MKSDFRYYSTGMCFSVCFRSQQYIHHGVKSQSLGNTHRHICMAIIYPSLSDSKVHGANMGTTCRPQVVPMLAPCTLLSGVMYCNQSASSGPSLWLHMFMVAHNCASPSANTVLTVNRHVSSMFWRLSGFLMTCWLPYGVIKMVKTSYGPTDVKYIVAKTKWPLFLRRHFQMHFLECKCLNIDCDFNEVSSCLCD